MSYYRRKLCLSKQKVDIGTMNLYQRLDVNMLIECLIAFCIFTNCCVFGGFVFWAHKYSCFNNEFIKTVNKSETFCLQVF